MLSAKVDQLNATPRLLLSAQTQPTGAASSTISTAPDLKTQLVALWKAIALSSRINTLSGSSQSPLTISNATVSGLSGLAVGDIPDLSSKYLPLTGATVPGSNIWTGLQQFTGNASTTGLSVFGLAYFGRTATSTFGADGSLTLASALGVGSGGTGWANINPGSILFGNGTSALATSSSLFWDNTNGRLGIGGALSVLGSANIASTTLTGNTLLAAATTTSLFASTFGLGSNYFTSLLGAGLANIGNALSLDLTHANLWTGLQQFFGNASTTQLSASSAYFGGTSTSTFTSAGWLGIGTTSPSKALSVLGDTLFSGTLNVSGGVTGASLFVTPGTGSALATLTAFDNTHDAATIFAVPGSRSWEIKANHSVDNNSLQFLNGIDGTMALQIGGTANTITTGGTLSAGTTTINGSLGILNQAGSAVQWKFDSDANSSQGRISNNNLANTLEIRNTAVGNGSESSFTFVDNSSNNSGNGAERMAMGYQNQGTGVFAQSDFIEASNDPQAGSTTNAPTPFKIIQTGYLNGSYHSRVRQQFGSNGDTTFYDANGAPQLSLPLLGNVGIGNYLSPTDALGVNGSVQTLGNDTGLHFNSYYSSGWKYAGSGYAGALQLASDGTLNYGVTNTTGTLGGAATLSNVFTVGKTGNATISGTLNVSGGVTGASLFVTPGTGSALATLTAFDNTHDAATIFAVPGSRSWEIKANHSVDNNSLQFLNGIDGTMALQIGGTANTITTSGSVGIGTTSPFAKLALSLNNGGTNSNAFLISSSTINATTTLFTVANTGSATLAGTLTQNSDQRLKTNVLTLDASSSLSAIDALNPVSFSWINNMFGEGGQLGLIAQDVQKLFPQLVSTTSATALTPDGTLGLNYTGLIAPIIGAIQGIAHITGDFQKNLIAWLGNASNGITDFFARNGHFSNELCVGTTCVTPQQFQAMVAASGQTTTSPSSSGQGGGTLSGGADSSTSASPAVPPVIAITGDNPAIIHVGDTYADLGAIITGPAEDLNLGIHTFVGSTPIEQAVLDTSTTATYHIYYVATDSTGATATSTRTVIVQAVAATTP